MTARPLTAIRNRLFSSLSRLCRYGNGYTEADLLKGWDNLLALMGEKWNVMGIDLKNEPRGAATWGTGAAHARGDRVLGG
jgi:aryl-phospho-beta-D-glucosidase BglC (GH1 family)